MFPRIALLTILTALFAGCAANQERDDPSTVGEAFTGAQDPRVGIAREAFRKGHGAATAFSFSLGDWTCKEIGAERDAPYAEKTVTYKLADSASSDSWVNSGTGFGAAFWQEGDEWIGQPSGASDGGIIEQIVLRWDNRGSPVFERILRWSTESLGPSDQTKWNAYTRQYQTAVSQVGTHALAVGYVTCDHEP